MTIKKGTIGSKRRRKRVLFFLSSLENGSNQLLMHLRFISFEEKLCLHGVVGLYNSNRVFETKHLINLLLLKRMFSF